MKTEDQNKNTKKKVNWKKVLVVATAIGVVGTGAYLGWRHFKSSGSKRKNDEPEIDTVPFTPALPAPNPPAYKPQTDSTSSWLPTYEPPVEKSDFPLKQGSKGDKVRTIQNYINYKFGKGSVTVDGDWGPGTQKAIIKFGLPSVIDESTYNVFAKAGAPSTYSVGSTLYLAVKNKDFNKAIAELKKLRNTSDYSEANNQFKTLNWLTKQNIAESLLSTFSLTSQRDSINFELLRIGLKYNGSSWSLSGIVKLIVTKEPTAVLEYPDKEYSVDKKIILGSFLEERNGYTLFATLDGKHKLLVKSNSIKYL